MLLILGLEVLKRFPEVIVGMTWLKCSKLEGVNARIGFEGPWKPAMSMGVLYAIAVWCATNGENVELYGAGTEGEGAGCAGMAKKESCCEAR